MGILKTSKYGGKYIAYQDTNGEWIYVKILDHINKRYIEPGYLTEDMLDQVMQGKTINFNAEVDGQNCTVSVKLVPYTTKDGRATFILKFDGEPQKMDDYTKIDSNLEKIALSYWDDANERFNWAKPKEVVTSLGLTHVWSTYATSFTMDRKKFGEVRIYRSGSRKNDTRYVYVEVDRTTNQAKYLDETQYKASIKVEEDYEAEQERIRKEKEAELIAARDAQRAKFTAWEDEIKKAVSGVSYTELIDYLEDLVGSRSPSSLLTAKMSLLNSYYKVNLIDYVFRPEYETYDICRQITTTNMSDEFVESLKETVLDKLKIYLEYRKFRHIRTALLNQYKNEGLEKVVEKVNVDDALDIGRFKEVKKALSKHSGDCVEYIIKEMYKDEFDGDALKTKLLNMLKVYQEFFDFPEKDRKALAKFIAVHNLKEYYEAVEQFDNAIEYLDEIRENRKLAKRVLDGYVGTTATSSLKSSTYSFELVGHVRKDMLVLKPVEILDRLRGIIKEYNASSDVVVMTNIELNADESLVFQFYTFSDDINGAKDFDGRRLQYMTKIYNQHYPDERIGFYFDN